MMKLILVTVFLLTVTMVGQTYISGISVTDLKFFNDPVEKTSLFEMVGLAFVMILGVFSSGVFKEINKIPEDSVHVREIIKKVSTSKKVIVAILISPIIFNSIYVVTGDVVTTVSDYLLGYQNGFFWEAVLSGISKKEKV